MTQLSNPREAVGDREHNKATARVLNVLSSFASDVPGYGITELSHVLGMTKNMTYRAVATLAEQGYLVRDANNARYHLGYRILELQNHDALEPDFRALCGPFMRRIHSLLGESVSLAVRALDYCVLIDGMETRKPGVWRVRIGDLLPLYGPASGRALLASCSDVEIAAYIASHSPLRLPRTGEVLSEDHLLKQIAEIRERGYARVLRASNPPLLALAFTVWDIDGAPHGVISVGGPNDRFQPQLDLHWGELLEIIEELNGRARLFSSNSTGRG